ncbi:response regulator [uncultured Flavobacterium sp.]|uniref:response regulator n=1 Tax=uncultured Flavobacterium sp. TaxID=165435 RepID=UPI0030EE038D|tara:strand:- start:132326 stop:132721 length:396 start_codon:yes stop_codon:yes gene_type:complete
MKKKSIWIIDDDSIFKIIIQKLISKTEIFDTVKTFSNGKEASTAIKKTLNLKDKLPDIILLDIEMPVMDGWEFMDEISILKQNFEKEEEINIFISSSSIAIDDKIKADKNPCIKGFLSKPISLDDLIKIAS